MVYCCRDGDLVVRLIAYEVINLFILENLIGLGKVSVWILLQ